MACARGVGLELSIISASIGRQATAAILRESQWFHPSWVESRSLPTNDAVRRLSHHRLARSHHASSLSVPGAMPRHNSMALEWPCQASSSTCSSRLCKCVHEAAAMEEAIGHRSQGERGEERGARCPHCIVRNAVQRAEGRGQRAEGGERVISPLDGYSGRRRQTRCRRRRCWRECMRAKDGRLQGEPPTGRQG